MAPRILNIVSRTRVSVDPAKYIEMFGVGSEAEIPEHLRDWVVDLVLASQAKQMGAITDARRDRL